MTLPKPKILCLTSYDLDGPDYGATMRNRQLFRHLERFGDVRVLLAGDFQDESAKQKKTTGGFELLDAVRFQPTQNWSWPDRLRNEFDGKFLNTDWMRARAEDRIWLEKQIAEHDLIWIHNLRTANRFAIWRWPRAVLDVDDLPSGLYESHLAATGNAAEKFRNWRQSVLWRRREKLLAERFDAVCVCSEPDRRKLGADKRIFILPNGFSVQDEIIRRPANPARIGFVGNFQHAPNLDGVRWFVEKVWPLILKRNPQIKLRLAGGGENRDFQNVPNIETLGWVADMGNEMATWSLAIVPVRTGGGTRVKIAESFSRKCPVVSTRIGAYGYEVEDGRELLLADAPEHFAAKCFQILADPFQASEMAGRAWKKFLECWTWEAQSSRVAAVVESILKKN